MFNYNCLSVFVSQVYLMCFVYVFVVCVFVVYRVLCIAIRFVWCVCFVLCLLCLLFPMFILCVVCNLVCVFVFKVVFCFTCLIMCALHGYLCSFVCYLFIMCILRVFVISICVVFCVSIHVLLYMFMYGVCVFCFPCLSDVFFVV